MRSLLVALGLAAVASPAYAASPDARPASLRAIVLTGAKLPARVGGQLAAVRAKLRGFVPAPGFPKVVESKSVPGLKPGFEVIVLGVCSDSGADRHLADFLEARAREAVPGAYGRAVEASVGPSCPRMVVPKPEDDAEGMKLWAAAEKSPESAEALTALGNYVVSVGDLDSGEYLGLRALQVAPGHAGAKALMEKVGLLRAD